LVIARLTWVFAVQRADHHAAGDLVVGQALGDQDDGLALAVGQLAQARSGAGAQRLGDVPVDQLAGDRRGEAGPGSAAPVGKVLPLRELWPRAAVFERRSTCTDAG